MICEEACLHIGADPHASSTELREHLERCDACRHYQCAMGALDVDLRKALSLGPALPAREERRMCRRPCHHRYLRRRQVEPRNVDCRS